MKWLPVALVAPLLLTGCSSPPKVFDIGTTKEGVPSQRRIVAHRLSREIKANPQNKLFLIRWVFDNHGKKSNSELAYNRNAGTLTLDELRYSSVTDQAIESIATQNQSIEQLTKYGAVKIAPSG